MFMAARVREKAWLNFIAWCRARRLTPLPAHPWTVAAYVRWCESRHRFPGVVEQVRAIARAHLLHCCPAPDTHPTVARTLRLVEARERTRAERAALFRDSDFAGGTEAQQEPRPQHGDDARSPRRSRRAPMPSTPRLISKRPSDHPENGSDR